MANANALVHETSPYLLQHAYNPVHWHPWGEEAFAIARREEKPVFLSIGYSTCHWCHVMAKESFEDESVAKLLNRYFVCIKVDKEERPDIDNVYMRACQAMTGSGGWPTSIFMAADGKPFYAGTYYPKAYFVRVVELLGQTWQQDRKNMLLRSEQLATTLGKESRYQAVPASELIEAATQTFRNAFDQEWGGFGSAPKFPSPHNLMFLLTTGPELAEQTLSHMYQGGVFDHVGGGFCRYATDRRWLIPHFEKMLYDNALLAMTYLLAYEKSGQVLYQSVARRIFAYLEQEMQSETGGFFSAQDADVEGEEGKYYLFTQAELMELLGREDGERFCRVYGIHKEGNFEQQNIPNLLEHKETDPMAEALLPEVYAYRKHRMTLPTDQKILTGWNALVVAAYAVAYRVLREKVYLQHAERTLDFLLDTLTEGNSVFSGVTGGQKHGPAFLDDYAYLIFALLQMHQASLEERYLARAAALAKGAIARFADVEQGGFFFSGKENEKLLLRTKENYDGALPSGNSVMAYNFTRLAFLSKDQEFSAFAEQQQNYMNSVAAISPTGCGFYLYAALPVREIVCATKNPAELAGLHVKSNWLLRASDAHEPQYPLVNGQATYYVCEDGVCRPPMHQLS